MSTVGLALRYLSQVQVSKGDFSRSSANTENTLTISAPGSGKAVVLLSAVAFYSDQSENDVTIDYTDRGGVSKSITVTTGSSSPPARQLFPIPDVGGIATQGNTSVTVTAPAGGAGITSDIRATWSEVQEAVIADVIAGVS